MNVFFRIGHLQKEQLRNDDIGHRVIHGGAQEYNSVHEQPGVNIVLTFTTIATAIFILLQGPRIADGALELILDDFKRERARRLGRNVADSVAGYVNGNLLISLLAASVTAIALLVMRVPFVTVLAAVMFFLDLIPLVGATLGGTVVTAATFVLDPHPWKALVFAGFFLVYQEIESHTLYPVIMGRKVKIGSFGVFLVTLAGGELGGIIGAFLAIPVGAAISVVVKDMIDERRNKALAVATPTTRLELARVADLKGGVPSGEAKAEPKAGAVGARHDAAPAVVDHDRDVVVRDRGPQAHGALALRVGVHDDVGARLGDGQLDVRQRLVGHIESVAESAQRVPYDRNVLWA